MDKNKETIEEVHDQADNDLKVDDIEPKEVTESPKEDDSQIPTGVPVKSVKKTNRFKRFMSTKKGKAVVIIGVVILIIATLLAVPVTRYGILGNIVKKNIRVMVIDSATAKPVSQAIVTLGDKSAKTDKKGEATLDSVAVGEYTLRITKGYYKTNEAAYTVPVLGEIKQTHISLVATGRQVSLSVSNKITGAVLTGATVTVKDTSAVTDSKGVATIVLPADKKTFQGTVSLDGYNQSAVDIKVTDQTDANKVALIPAGDVYYLSKQTGKINVMKSHLDGTSASVVVEGTGNENDRETVLLAARDWNYMALFAKRSADSKKPGQLYLVDTKSGNLKTIDEGDATFQLVGWSDHKFVYLVTRNNRNLWESNTERLKSYDAETGKLTILDENAATGGNNYDYQYESLRNAYILNDKIVYTKIWDRNYFAPSLADKKSAIMSVNPDGSQKQRVKEFSMQSSISIEAKLYEPQEIYFRVSIDSAGSNPEYYEYQNNTVKGVSNTDDKFYNTFYPTYLVSPNGQKTFWYEPRDGKNTLLIGDRDGKDSSTLATQSEYTAYGWYGDKYILLSKNDSELYIASADKPLEQPLKITNFHKPSLRYPGYGYGYGGQ